jgi:hypothetical protein
VYNNMLGDKDSFRLAFHLAGRGVNYTQVSSSLSQGVVSETSVASGAWSSA